MSNTMALSRSASATNTRSITLSLPIIEFFRNMTFIPSTSSFDIITNASKFHVISNAVSVTLKLKLPLGFGQFMTADSVFNQVFFSWDIASSTLTIWGSPANLNQALNIMRSSIYNPANNQCPVLLAASENGQGWILGKGNVTQFGANHAPVLTGEQYTNITQNPGALVTKNLTSLPACIMDPDGDSLEYFITSGDGSPIPSWSEFSKNIWSGTYSERGRFNFRVWAVDAGGLISPALGFFTNFIYIPPFLLNLIPALNLLTAADFNVPIPLNTFSGVDLSYYAKINGERLPSILAELMFNPSPPTLNGNVGADSVFNITVGAMSPFGDSVETSMLVTFTSSPSFLALFLTYMAYLTIIPTLWAIYRLRYEIPNALLWSMTSADDFFNEYGEHIIDYPYEVYPQVFHKPSEWAQGYMEGVLEKAASLVSNRLHEWMSLTKLPDLGTDTVNWLRYDKKANIIYCHPEKITEQTTHITLHVVASTGRILTRTIIDPQRMKTQYFKSRENNLAEVFLLFQESDNPSDMNHEHEGPGYTAIEMSLTPAHHPKCKNAPQQDDSEGSEEQGLSPPSNETSPSSARELSPEENNLLQTEKTASLLHSQLTMFHHKKQKQTDSTLMANNNHAASENKEAMNPLSSLDKQIVL